MSSSDVRGVPVEPGPPGLGPLSGALRLSRHPRGCHRWHGRCGGGGIRCGARGVHHLGTLQRTGGRGGRGGSGTGPNRTGLRHIRCCLSKRCGDRLGCKRQPRGGAGAGPSPTRGAAFFAGGWSPKRISLTKLKLPGRWVDVLLSPCSAGLCQGSSSGALRHGDWPSL
ncbi:hypothetical protein MRX96_018131 [Rhipicephalus microplus]